MNDRRYGGASERLLAALLVAAVALVVVLTAVALLEAANYGWNDIRLVPSAGLLEGLSIYPPPGQAAVIGHIYGPVGPLVYLPAALLPTPSAAVRAGALTAFLAALAPLVVLILSAARRRTDVQTLACIALAALYMFSRKGMSRMTFSLHVDGPAIGLGALACWCMYDRRRRSDWRWLVAAAVAAALAVGVKQVMLPIVLALPVYVALADGWRAAARLAGLIGVAGIAALGLTLVFVDLDALVFYGFFVPSQHEYQRSFWEVMVDLAPRSSPPLLIAAVFGALSWRAAGPGPGFRAWLRDNPWTLLLFVAIFCLPTSMLGRAKDGGAVQVLNFSIYPLFAAAVLALVEFGQRTDRVAGVPARRLVTWLLVVALTALMVDTLPRARRLPAALADLPRESTAAAFRFVQEHPEQVWIPFRPLITLKADGHLYHTVFETMTGQILTRAVGEDRDATDRDETFMRAFVPADLRYILYQVDGGTPLTAAGHRTGWEGHVREYFPEFSEDRDLGLQGWRALVRADDPD